MMNTILAPNTLERLQQHAHQSGISADNLINRLLDSTPIPSPIPYATIVNQMEDMIALVTPNKRYALVNKAMQTTTGIPIGQIIGKTTRELGFPEDIIRISDEDYDAVLTTRQDRRRIFDFTGADGVIRTYETRLSPIFDGKDEIIYMLWVTHDITKRRKAEQAIRHSEASYRLLFQEAPVAIWKRDFSAIKTYLEGIRASGVADIEGYLRENPDEIMHCLRMVKTLDANLIALKTYKSTSVEEVNQHFIKIVATGEPQPASLAALVHGKTSFSGEFINKTLDGKDIYLLIKWIVLPGHEARYDEVLVVTVDITEQKLAEQAIRQSEASYRLLFQEAPVAIWKRDFSEIKTYLDGLHASGIEDMEAYLRQHPDEIMECHHRVKTIDANYIALKTHKSTSVEEVSQHFIKIVTTGEPQPASLAAIARGETSFSGEFINKTLDGKDIYLLLKWLVLPGHEARYDEVLVVTVDITERKLAEQAIRQSEASYRRLFQEAPIAIWKRDFSELKKRLEVLRASGIEDIEGYLRANPHEIEACLHSIKTLDANNVALEMYRSDSVEEINTHFNKLVSVDEPQPASLMAVIDGKTSFSGEFVDKTLDGKLINLLLKWIVLPGHEATFDEVLVTTLDITEQKRYQQTSIENESLTARFRKEQEHNSLIQRSIAALSHDLRTPLSVIATSKDLLLRHFDKLTEEKRKEKLESIGRQLEFALELLDDTVMMVRGALSERPFHPTMVKLGKLCQVSVSEVGMSYGAEARLKFVNVGRVDSVLVDEILVSRILLNLLSNAIKYSPNNTDIRLELHQTTQYVLLRVIDKGLGIHPDNLPHIFEPFYRVAETQDIKGTGLGLSIVQECVERHHGRIWVESELGIGTTFTVELPIIPDGVGYE